MYEPFQNKDGILYIENWAGVTAGFTTREGGVSEYPYHSLNVGLHVQDRPEVVQENRRILSEKLTFPLESWICSVQVHDNHVQRVENEDKGKGVFQFEDGIPDTDGIYTTQENMLLTSCYADCVPLYFYAPFHHLIGLAHAGWKGTAKGIALEMVRKWGEDEQVPLTNINVAIGPSIGDCCYVVDDRVLDAIQKTMRNPVPHKVVSAGQYAINLKEINRQLVLQAGIPDQNIAVSSFCTSCEKDLFFSHRRDGGKTGRMMSFIGFKEGYDR